jgi:hypothetical protein
MGERQSNWMRNWQFDFTASQEAQIEALKTRLSISMQ